jgi:hypothetical protein
MPTSRQPIFNQDPMKIPSSIELNRLPVVEKNMAILTNGKPQDPLRLQADIAKREKYSSMKSHMEMAAVVLAAGGTQRMAAQHAGVSKRQVHKYITSSQFRERVAELREIIKSRVGGRILAEFVRRTEPETIGRMEILDLTRIYDRVEANAFQMAPTEVEVTPAQQKHDSFLQQIININTGDEKPDFPSYESSYVQLPEGDSRGD